MSYAADTRTYLRPYNSDRSASRVSGQAVSGQAISGMIALACGVAAAAWMLYGRPVAAPDEASVSKATRSQASVAAPAPVNVPHSYNALLDPGYSLGAAPTQFAQNSPFGSNAAPSTFATPGAVARNAPFASLSGTIAPDSSVPNPAPRPASPTDNASPTPLVPDVAEGAPLPAPRPPEFRPSRLSQEPVPPRISRREMAQQKPIIAPPPAQADNRSFFERLFGAQQQPGQPQGQQPSRTVLAYATPDAGLGENALRGNALRGNVLRNNAPTVTSSPASPDDRFTAVYDISAHVVYMPNGARLEAHSGIGPMLDDPRYVAEKNRGATPPHVYELEPRAQLFHGVQALRLNPVDGGGIYGRTGLLAHSFMLGPNGDSNGCVSFRDYNAFLQAYMNGEIKHLMVVAHR